jgi:1-acyl-sn-glycerol-3-phosphate acyltransferase
MNRIVTMVLNNLIYVPGAWIKLCRYAKNVDSYPETERWAHIQYILKRAVIGGNVDLVVTGLENVPRDQSFMMYSNHQGLFDCVAIASTCPVPLGAVLKKELVGIPFIQQVKECTKSYAMDREDVRQSLQVIQAVTEEVKNGRNYIIFPEGTRSKNGNTMGEFHGGSFRCATKAKCPVVPVAVVDCYKVLDEKGSRPLTVQLHYLEPIPYEEFQDMKPAELAELTKARIAAKIQECTQGG